MVRVFSIIMFKEIRLRLHLFAPKTRVLPGPLSGPWTPAELQDFANSRSWCALLHSWCVLPRKNTFFHLKICSFFLSSIILFLKVTGWQLNIKRSRMRVPIFLGKGVFFGCLSREDFPEKVLKRGGVFFNESPEIFRIRGIFSKPSWKIKKLGYDLNTYNFLSLQKPPEKWIFVWPCFPEPDEKREEEEE